MTNEQPCLTILALGLQQRCEAERHLGRYLERIVNPEGYTDKA